MTIKHYTHFLAVLEYGSIYGAAKALNISQPALSKSIARMEEEYGVALFDRWSRGVRPTIYAGLLQRHAQQIIQDVERSKEATRSAQGGYIGTLALGSGPTFIPMVHRALEAMIAEFGMVDFKILQGHNDYLKSHLLTNEIDAYIGMITGYEDTEQFSITELFTDRVGCVCRRSHPIFDGPVRDRELLSYPWVVTERGEIGRTALEGYFKAKQMSEPHVQISTNSEKLIQICLTQRDFLGFLPHVALEQEEYRDLVRIDGAGPQLKRKVGLVSRRHASWSPLQTSFAGRLMAIFKDARTFGTSLNLPL